MIANLQESILAITEQTGGTWGVVIEDLQSHERFTLNPDERFYAASIIKLPIMTAVFAQVYSGKLSFEQTIPLRQEDLVGGDGVLKHMSVGLPLTVHDLVTLMIIQSDNTATNVLIDLVGTENIREMMRKTGMHNSAFYNKLMIIPAELEGKNEVTAADVASHLRHLATGQILSYNSCLQMISLLKKQQQRDSLPSLLPDPEGEIIGSLPLWELANKAGSITDIKHDAGILYVDQAAVIITTLSKNVDEKPAKKAMGEIGRLVYEAYKR